MSDEKPLHVRVAEALGCGPYYSPVELQQFPQERADWERYCALAHRAIEPYGDGWFTLNSHTGHYGFDEPPRYDTDWSATGPLVEKYEINLTNDLGYWIAYVGLGFPEGDRHYEYSSAHSRHPDPDETPLQAVCHLLLVLKEAGKL